MGPNDETAYERRRRAEQRGFFVMRVPRRRRTKLNDYLVINRAAGGVDLFRCSPENIARFLMMNGAQGNQPPH
jgi:hypothetical protein